MMIKRAFQQHHKQHFLKWHYTTTATLRFYTTKEKRYNILFFGSDAFSLASLKMLNERTNHQLFVMVPQEMKPTKENLPVKEYCDTQNLPYVHPESLTKLTKNDFDRVLLSDVAQERNVSSFDIGVAVSFRYFIPKSILQEFKVASLNVHPSLLPQYRGPAPIHHVLLNGEKETGISIIDLDPNKFDVGNILFQEATPIAPDETFPVLYDRLAKRGAEILHDVIQNIDECKAKSVSQQGAHDVEKDLRRAPKVNAEMRDFNWEKDSVETVYNKWRALESLRAQFNGEEQLFVDMHRREPKDSDILPQMMAKSEMLPPGSYLFDKVLRTLYIKCSDGWIGCDKLQKAGKRVFTAIDYNHQQFMKMTNKNRDKSRSRKR